MRKTCIIPYLILRNGLVTAFLFLLGTSNLIGQVSIRRVRPVDSVFSKIDTLKAAIVTASLRPRMKGDTLEYNTQNILMRKNSVVEDLLRRLPGLQIDADGNITYNGEKIQHLLVNGEDIFGSDPTLVTRSFDATKIAKVQLLDRKSEQTLFTGVDDGTRTKTLNLVLKESANNGSFGKIEVGGNTTGYYNASAALAAFRDKEQFTALGFASNTGVLGFSSNSSNGRSAILFLNGNTDPLNASAGTGIPKFQAAALHYANTWDQPGDHVLGNYQYSYYRTEPILASTTIETQPGSVYLQDVHSRSTNQQTQNWGYVNYELNMKSRSAWKFELRATSSQSQNEFQSTGNSFFNDTLVNGSQRTINDEVTKNNIGGGASWRIQIGKKGGRILSTYTDVAKTDVDTRGQLYSINRFYGANGSLQSMDTVDQRKRIYSHALKLMNFASYTEPLWKGAQLGAFYNITYVGDDPLQATYDRGDGKYQDLVDSLSTHFRARTLTQTAMLTLQGNTKKMFYSVTSALVNFAYRQRDLMTDSILRVNSLNWAPRAVMSYAVDPSLSVNFDFSITTKQPPIAQMQATRNNSDPLHITLGNPDLRQESDQSLRIGIRRMKAWMIEFGASFGTSNNAISTRITTDSLGRQISQPVNVNGGKTAGFNLSVGRKILGIDLNGHLTGTFGRNVSYVNDELSKNDNYTSSAGFSVNKYVADKYSLQLTTNFAYFDQRSDINTGAPVRYWSQNHNVVFSLFVTRDFQLNTNAAYTWQEKSGAFGANTSVLLWNESATQDLLKGKVSMRLSLNNILNENAGISRSNVNNINTQISANILGRYWMLSAIYHFDKKFKQK